MVCGYLCPVSRMRAGGIDTCCKENRVRASACVLGKIEYPYSVGLGDPCDMLSEELKPVVILRPKCPWVELVVCLFLVRINTQYTC